MKIVVFEVFMRHQLPNKFIWQLMNNFIHMIKAEELYVTHSITIFNQQVTKIWKKAEDQSWILQKKENV